MAKAVLLTIGDELTSGRVVNSNSATISTLLRGAGIETPLHLTCNDDVGEIVKWLTIAHQEAEVVITTGGLGPTDDDLTHGAVARYAGVELELRQEELDRIRARFKGRGMKMPDSNIRQAMLPAGATVIPNHHGTAPGSLVEVGGRWVATLPGIPREMRPMLEETVIPALRDRFDLRDSVKIRILKTYGFTESRLAEIMAELPPTRPEIRVGYRPSFPEIHLSLTVAAPSEVEADQWISEYESTVRAALGSKLWGVDDDEYSSVVGDLLRMKGMRMASAESCTGGLVGKMMTDIAGSSDYYERGFITYTNEAKQQLLGVPVETFVLGGPGAVSEECALAMAKGARERAGVDVAVSITGVAGPGGGSPEKPVGTVWIGLATPEGTSAKLYFFPGPRSWVRTLSAYTSLERLRRYLLELQDFEPMAKRPGV